MSPLNSFKRNVPRNARQPAASTPKTESRIFQRKPDRKVQQANKPSTKTGTVYHVSITWRVASPALWIQMNASTAAPIASKAIGVPKRIQRGNGFRGRGFSGGV